MSCNPVSCMWSTRSTARCVAAEVSRCFDVCAVFCRTASRCLQLVRLTPHVPPRVGCWQAQGCQPVLRELVPALSTKACSGNGPHTVPFALIEP